MQTRRGPERAERPHRGTDREPREPRGTHRGADRDLKPRPLERDVEFDLALCAF